MIYHEQLFSTKFTLNNLDSYFTMILLNNLYTNAVQSVVINHEHSGRLIVRISNTEIIRRRASKVVNPPGRCGAASVS